MIPLTEQYRPREWSDVIGQTKAVKRIDALRRRGLAGRLYWLSGQTGIGKTTIARLIAAEIAEPDYVIELDAGSITPNGLRDIERAAHLSAPGRGGRVWIVNEAHGLRADVIRQLLVLAEPLPSHVAIIFTTTKDGEAAFLDDKADARPLLGRATRIALTNQGLCKAAAPRLKEIAVSEGLDGQPVAAYERLLKDCKNSIREALQRIDSGEMIAE